jgi:hypothetical protein
VLTATGTANINGEANLTFDGSNLILVPGTSGVTTGLYVNGGDITAARSSTTGVIYFGTNSGIYLYYDGSNYLFGGTGPYVSSGNSFRAPIFYDSNDTNYYLDPASTTLALRVNGNIEAFARSASWAEGVRVRVPTTSTWGGFRLTRDRGNFDGNWGWGYVALDSTDDLVFGANNGGSQVDNILRMTKAGVVTAGYDLRAPILYDSNNTGFYCDPSSTSVLARIMIQNNVPEIQFADSDQGESRYLHCNGGALGFLGNTGSWIFRTTNSSGELYGSMFADIYYDRNNTAYYIDPVGTSVITALSFASSTNGANLWGANDWGLRLSTNSGYIQFGPANTGHAHIYTDRSNFYFNQQLIVNGGSVINTSDIRASIFYDLDNTAYYVNGQGGSRLNEITIDQGYNFGWWRNYGQQGLYNQDYGVHFYGTNSEGWAITGSGGNIQLQFRSNHNSAIRGYLYCDTANTMGFLTSGGNWRFQCNDAGQCTAAGDLRAPIFYDSNDTGYYADFNSLSDSAVRVRGGTLHGPNATWGAYLLVGGNGRNNYINSGTPSVCATNGNLHLDAGSGFETYINYYDGNNIYFGGGQDNIVGRINSSGVLTMANDVIAFGSPSDESLKENIKPIDKALDKLLGINGVYFDWKEDTDASSLTKLKSDIGFIAQQVKGVLPELVRENDNGLLSLRDKGIIAITVEAIKEQQKQIDELKEIISNLVKK